MKKILIAGLGNPGRKYKDTPHNVGFSVIDNIAEALRVKGYVVGESHGKEAATYEVPLGETQVVLVKPLLFMNRSGEVVKNFFTGAPEDLWVVHDDIDLPIGALRIKRGGSAAGHKGVKNIADRIETDDFYRLRIGVRPENMPDKRPQGLTSEFVTKKLSKSSREEIKKIETTTTELVLTALEMGSMEELTGNYSIQE